MDENKDWTTDTGSPVPKELALPLFKARAALFKVDLDSATVHERFSHLLLAFAAGALAAIVGGYEALSTTPLYGSIVVAALLLVCSLLGGAGQVLVGHYVALANSGIPHGDALTPALEGLNDSQKLQMIQRVFRELKGTRFWPESYFIESALKEKDLLVGISDHLRRIQVMVNVQALCFRAQLVFAVLASLPLLVGLIQEAL